MKAWNVTFYFQGELYVTLVIAPDFISAWQYWSRNYSCSVSDVVGIVQALGKADGLSEIKPIKVDFNHHAPAERLPVRQKERP